VFSSPLWAGETFFVKFGATISITVVIKWALRFGTERHTSGLFVLLAST